jgi:phosphomannomutase
VRRFKRRHLGLQAENAGKIPTPALVLRAISNRRAGVMVTGSHIPFDRNGIKINKSHGEVLKSDEAGIIAEVERVRVEEYGRSAESSMFDACGVLKGSPELPPLDHTGEDAYVDRYVNSFAPGILSGLCVLVYQHSAVGRDLLVGILSKLGAEVRAVGRSDTFIPIDTENITDEQLDRLQEFAATVEAEGFRPHAIVSTDGDSDRPLVTAVLPAAGGVRNERRVICSASSSPNTCAPMRLRCRSAPTTPSSVTCVNAISRSKRPRSVRRTLFPQSMNCALPGKWRESSAGRLMAAF